SLWLLKPIPEWVDTIGARSFVISGGVACNSKLRSEAGLLAQKLGLRLAIPEPRLCTDNGAMIAAAGAMLPLVEAPWAENADSGLALNPAG
ncbi:MAG: tRNA (adenosine(37)-N6)-threonylcarbamoyltransferase complex transferase subunit TsaD, partial [Acidobacteriota bacterium]|nr:tRNA (adenosine(37)-N6)-threonylcarbamoyltransferase complex transferase subunit TsaD [Acidobacteriota bacterium]